ncbi:MULTISPECIES: hypothetical protein [Shewanella]|uniref:hypothetical protein n=1 Tax=Shewanella TaxID=22 RepID=UPI0004910469|nr:MULTISPECIES: hypothetical protein [Shewanella]QLE85835.1 hypothetical protein FLM48_12615 [Shewanella sp. Scap07]
MVSFKYDLNQDFIELQASNWNGLERVFVNGKMVSKKLNFSKNSEHHFQLDNGTSCKFQLLIDPSTEQLVCRIFKKNNLVTSLKQGKDNLLASQHAMQGMVLFSSIAALALVLVS